MIGKTISRYRILDKLGEGGMGVVYKAEDLKLKRTVALKFLTAQVLGSQEEKARFVREAQAAATLNHPNICTVYEIDEAEERIFIAMECVEGQSLEDRIKSGPLKLDEAVDLAVQIAEGLQEAHEKGVVHRDIKPANIMVTSKGQAKIMDFGLAKSAKRTTLTKTGTTLGTVAYMSPEQARGESVDHRTDIWSLGVVLYEMVTGQRAFKGDYEQAVLYSILNAEPEPMTARRTGVPMELERIVAKAMAREPGDRYQHVDELPVDLRAIKARPSGTVRVPATAAAAGDVSRPVRWKWAIPWVLSLLMVVVAALALRSAWRERVTGPRTVSRFTVSLPSADHLWIGPVVQQPSLALSPDGSKLVYIVSSGGLQQLHLREMDQFESRPIPGTEDARGPFFSPDGEWVGFLTGGKLKKVSLSSGASVSLCNILPDVSSGGSWGNDDRILFTPSPSSGLARVSANGGVPQQVTFPDSTRGELGHWYPTALPDGKGVLFAIRKGGGFSDTDIGILSPENGEWHTLIEGGTSPHYDVSSGNLVYAKAGAILSVPFDLGRLKTTGPPVRILEGVMTISGAEFSLSADGSMAYIPGTGARPKLALVWVDRQGRSQPLPLPPAAYSYPRLSPDGGRLVTEICGDETGNYDIWICDLARNTRSRLTFDPDNDSSPIWTRDGSRVTFASSYGHKQAPNLSWKLADGTGAQEQLSEMDASQFPTGWSPNGRVLLFTSEHPDTKLDVWMLPLDGELEPRPLFATEFDETAGVVSPDGQWIAYQSDESGRYEIYVRPFRESGTRYHISTDGGTEPVWAPDGHELFYRNGDRMMVVSLQAAPEFVSEEPQLLFEGRYATDRVGADYDITPDGQRFLMIKLGEAESGPPRELKIILNWSEEIKRYPPQEK